MVICGARQTLVNAKPARGQYAIGGNKSVIKKAEYMEESIPGKVCKLFSLKHTRYIGKRDGFDHRLVIYTPGTPLSYLLSGFIHFFQCGVVQTTTYRTIFRSDRQRREKRSLHQYIDTRRWRNRTCRNVFSGTPFGHCFALGFSANQKCHFPGASQPRRAQRHPTGQEN